jgi:hypothetical protein
MRVDMDDAYLLIHDKKLSGLQAPEPMAARGDSLGCSRNPGASLYAGLFAPSQ